MRRLYIPGLIALVGIIIGLAWAEQITLSTYYPAPYGVYRQVRLHPTDDFTPGADCSGEEGALFYHDTTNRMYVCDGSTNTWQPLGGGGVEGTWSSEWYPVTAQVIALPPPPTSLPRTFTHDLDSEALMTQVLFAPDDGTGNPDLTKVSALEYSDFNFAGGRVEITPTQLTVTPGYAFLYYRIDGTTYDSGFYKVLAIRID